MREINKKQENEISQRNNMNEMAKETSTEKLREILGISNATILRRKRTGKWKRSERKILDHYFSSRKCE